MTVTNAEQLEGMISSNINTQFKEVPPSEAEFDKIADTLRQSLASFCPVTDHEFEDLKRRLKANIVVVMDIGVVIKDDKRPHQSWLPSRRSELDFFFWNRYKKYLEEIKHWNPRVTGNLGRVSDEIVDLLGDPKAKNDFQRRGLVLGDVQSGKTANYTAICNKAADTGYRVIIVLAGMMENLRQQTQERLDAEFSGRKSEYFLDPTKKEIRNEPVGVGRYGTNKRIASFTSVVKDFDINILKSNDLSLLSVSDPVVFVVKKNKSILNNLIRWLRNNNAVTGQKIDLPMLLIDDEADNASVNTKKEDEDPTAINQAVRTLLALFRQASYLGITATPYANIFINPDTTDDMRGDDLFPRDFIYSLAPPSNYIGADSIFGVEAPFRDALEELHPQEMNAFFPFSHKKGHPVTELPPSMKEAMAYFLLINGIRDVSGDFKAHRSMMIHVSRFTNVQNQIRDLATEWILQMRSDLQNYSRLSETESSKIPGIAYLKAVWDKYLLSRKAGLPGNPMPWHKFLSEYLFKAAAPIDVRAVNQESGATSLDYFNHREDGLRVIAVGGNSLSRGLTLEGLCVSYFYRRSQMYDTLLQMGRWFGYRLGYDDLFKIWISVEAIDWYGYITAAAEELKLEIARMKNANLTPLEFGLKVRQDPASLIVTARNKMRAGTMVKRPVTVSGRLLETPRLKSDDASLKANEDVFMDFVRRLDIIGQRTTREDARYFWEGVNKDEVEQLLRDFKTHPWHLSFQGQALADFIRDKMGNSKWDVVIAEGSVKDEYTELYCGSEQLMIRPEKRTIIATREQISISGTKVRVGSGGATKLGLTKKQREDAEAAFIREHPGKTNVSDSTYLIEGRAPILMLHVIAVDRISIDKNGKVRTQIEEGCQVPDFLFALGAGFPFTGLPEETASYMVNMVELSSYYDSEEDNDE
ncbi:Z1 domain-containing protein [Desulfosporosinus metallidurans]|uniref:Endonuclease n=1 Tax=Desulfosporosinus metallidurans TaxID=1888891 RepID=A0A1Q8QH70_9FIRM|nr:Z1 domain-containing protein [Desulfosporosinus metallidurans]OLN26661.1 Endonuclease [Desulfosporosinus metallidurans]